MRTPLRWLATTLALATLPGVSLAQNWLDGFEPYAVNSPI